MTQGQYVKVEFEHSTRPPCVVVRWFDGSEMTSRVVAMREDNLYAHVQEAMNNGLRFVLNAIDRERKLQQAKKKETNDGNE